MTAQEPTAPEPTTRSRRRAVGPAGARPQVPTASLGLDPEPDPTSEAPADGDERLRRDVPPHHGS